MKNNTVRYLFIGFGFSLLLFLISTAASYISINRLVDSYSLVNKTNVVSLELSNIISNMKDAETGYRGYLVSQDSSFLEPYFGSNERAQLSFDKVRALSANNPEQIKNLEAFLPIMNQRFQTIQEGIQRVDDRDFSLAQFNRGRALMDRARAMVDNMQELETRELANENNRLGKYIEITPVLVVGAALLSMFITLFAFFRITNDLRIRDNLQREVESFAETMSSRITDISVIAEKISRGEYGTRITIDKEDRLGGLAEALNLMACKLEENFSKLDNQAWLQGGVGKINDLLKNEKGLSELAQDALSESIHYLKGSQGVFYLLDDTRSFLSPVASYAFPLSLSERLPLGQGIVGQVAKDKKPVVLTEVDPHLFKVNSGLLDGALASVVVYPLVYNHALIGVMELGTVQELPDQSLDYLALVAENIAIALHTANNRLKVQELLQKTQTQSEELQVQQDQLQRTNTDLEEQSQKLQASEEELKVQQEELLQFNQDLEEKAQLLEEQNQFIAQKSHELVLLNDDINLKNTELEISGQYKSEFLANMSHELRTPLNSILLLAKLLADSKELDLGDDRYEYAKVIHNSGQGLLELINEILDLSKIEAGQMEISPEPTAFTEIENDLAAMFRPLAHDKNLDLEFHFHDSLPPTFISDKQRLEQVLKNLLSNAIKFTDHGKVTLSVALIQPGELSFGNAALEQQAVVAFAVKDTGIGIPEEKKNLVFEAFKQVDGSSRRSYGGTGLGLSISREIAKLLGGEIHLKSEQDVGSEFTMYLPLEATLANAETAPPEQRAPSSPTPSATEPVAQNLLIDGQPVPFEAIPSVQLPDDRLNLGLQDKVILVIEDDTAFIKALEPYIRKSGYKVLLSTRGDEGLALAREYKPQGILLDIHLPGLDGWTVMEQLKADPATRHIPVHTMSSEEARQKSLNLGAVEFLYKPKVEQELDSALQRIEEKSNQTSRRLLIIEHDAKHAQALASFFELHKIETTIALSGDEGIRHLESGQMDGVLLDISVNENVAYRVLERIKDDAAFETMPVVVYTGSNITQEDENRINRYASTSIVRKGDTYEKLLSEVSIFLHLVEENNQHHKPSKLRNKLIESELAGKTILLADDDARNLYSLKKVLQLQNVKVITANNGKEVMAFLATKPHLDAILIDIMMPEMDGYETTAALRLIPEYKNTPVIAVTAKTMPNDRNKCIAAGASDYLSKPVDVDQLLSLLRVWLY